MAAVTITALVLLGTRSGEPSATSETQLEPDRVETVERIEPLVLNPSRRGLDHVLVLAQPLGDEGGALLTVTGPDTVEHRVVGADEWPSGITDATRDDAYPDAEAGARSPDGTRIAVFARSSSDRTTGISIHTEGQPARQFHRMQSVADLVGRRIVWSPESDAVYFLAAGAEGSADRIIGIPVGGAPQTVATFGQRGFYGIAVVDQPATP